MIPISLPAGLACALAAASLFGLSSTHAAEFVLISEDFESYDPDNLDDDSIAPNGAIILSTVPDPEAGGTRGTVAEIDLSGANQWGAIDRVGGNIVLADLGASAGDTFEFTFDAYIPDSENFDAGDALTARARFTSSGGQDGKIEPASTPPAIGDILNVGDNDFGKWIPISLTGPIPALDSSSPQLAIRELEAILSIRDLGDDGVAGPALYIDNVELKITTSDVDPNANVAAANPFLLQKISDGTQIASIDVTNSGLRQTLDVSVALTGPDASNFVLDSETAFMLDPANDTTIDITFTPGAEPREYRATLNVTTNEAGDDSSIEIPLSVAIIPDEPGSNIFINGGFEFSNAVGWVSAASRLTGGRLPDSPVRTGTGSGKFVLTNPGNFKGFNLSQDVFPPMVAGAPNLVEITPGMLDQQFRFTGYVLSPEDNGFPEDGTLTLEIRWNNIVLDERYFAQLITSGFFIDQEETWLEVTASGFVPRDIFPTNEAPDPVPVDSAAFLIYTNSSNRMDTGNETIFFDDLSLEIDSIEVPEGGSLEITGVSVVENPNDPNSSVVSITFSAVLDTFYTIESSDDLNDWDEVAFDFPEDGAAAESVTFQDIVQQGVAKRFYRVTRQLEQFDP